MFKTIRTKFQSVLGNRKRSMYLVFISALLIRLMFVFWGAEYFYPGSIHITGDSGSFSQAFVNLYETGHYTSNPEVPDASFGRLPGYPFFWGVHYLVFGPGKVYTAVSVSQALLDSFSALLVFLIALHFTKSISAGFAAGLLYAFYPFGLVWVPITGTESVAVFLSLLLAYRVITKKHDTWNLLLAGALIAAAFFTREYLGIFLPLVGLYLWFKYGLIGGMKKSVIVGLVFLLLYLPWPIRNYVNHGRFILVTSPASGYIRYAEDVRAFRSWLFTWHPSDWQPYFDEILYGEGEVDFPAWVFANDAEKQIASDLVDLCRECGSGFHAWKHRKQMDFPDCNKEIANGFMLLRSRFIKHQPWVYYVSAPMKSVAKSIFNLQIQSHEGQNRVVYGALQGLFIYRGVLLILALGAGFYLCIRKRDIDAGFLISFPVFMIFFLSFYLRQVEMRYLLQAEIFVLPLVGIIIYRLINQKFTD